VWPKLTEIPKTLVYSSSLFLHHDKFLVDLLRGKNKNNLKTFDSFSVPSQHLANDTLLRSGYRVSTTSMDHGKLIKNAETRAKYYLDVYSKKNEQESLALLRESAQSLKDKGVIYILISAPVTKYYRSHFPKAHLESLSENLEKLSTELKVPYYNFSDDEAFVDTDFTNSDHLNIKGATKFTNVLNRIIKKQIEISP